MYTAQMVIEEVADFFEDIVIATEHQAPPAVRELDNFWHSDSPLLPLHNMSIIPRMEMDCENNMS